MKVNKKHYLTNIFFPNSLMLCLLFPTTLWAGSLDSPGDVTHLNTQMYTISDIYNRLNTGATGTKGSFTEPASAPGSTGYTLDQVMGKAPEKDEANGVSPAEVPAGKTFWGLKDANWGKQTGTGDNVVDTSSGDAVASDIKKGKKAWVNGSEVTGTSYGGFTCTGAIYNAGSGGTRWCDNGDGTVTDLSNGLVWLKNASCSAALASILPPQLKWDDAQIWSSLLEHRFVV